MGIVVNRPPTVIRVVNSRNRGSTTLGFGRHPNLVGADNVLLVLVVAQKTAYHFTAVTTTADNMKHREVAENAAEGDLYRYTFERGPEMDGRSKRRRTFGELGVA